MAAVDETPDDEVPPRVLAAEHRREFRLLAARGSLGCPLEPPCDHPLSWHRYGDVDDRGRPIDPICRYCDCGR